VASTKSIVRRGWVPVPLAALLLLLSVLLSACESADLTTPTAVSATLVSATTLPVEEAAHPSTTVVRDTGVSTTSTIPLSLPALPSGITAAQVRELLSDYSGVPEEQWEARDHQTFGEWAAAIVYARALSNQMTHAGWGAVFREEKGAWLFQGFVEPYDLSQAKVSLDDMDVSEEVRAYFAQVAYEAPEDVFVAELRNQEILLAQTLDECRNQDSLRDVEDISSRLDPIYADLMNMHAPTERARQVADQLMLLVERLKSAVDRAAKGILSQAEFDSEVLLVTDHLPLATDNIDRLLRGQDVTTTTTIH
jgi:hypothetical protein